MRVYLAGGMRSGWQGIVMQAVPDFAYLDPRDAASPDPDIYTPRDLAMIAEADTVFAYMESNNPGGYALGLEVGYAIALGKRVIFVMDPADPRRRYFDMIAAVAETRCTDLESGIEALKRLAIL